MKIHDVMTIADTAVSANAARAATAILHDSDDARVVVFRIDPGQTVPLHTSDSSVMLAVARGPGFVSGSVNGAMTETVVSAGAVITYEPGELHGMRAGTSKLVVVATIAPRPGVTRIARVA